MGGWEGGKEEGKDELGRGRDERKGWGGEVGERGREGEREG